MFVQIHFVIRRFFSNSLLPSFISFDSSTHTVFSICSDCLSIDVTFSLFIRYSFDLNIINGVENCILTLFFSFEAFFFSDFYSLLIWGWMSAKNGNKMYIKWHWKNVSNEQKNVAFQLTVTAVRNDIAEYVCVNT